MSDNNGLETIKQNDALEKEILGLCCCFFFLYFKYKLHLYVLLDGKKIHENHKKYSCWSKKEHRYQVSNKTTYLHYCEAHTPPKQINTAPFIWCIKEDSSFQQKDKGIFWP